jgi:hypothetical protein
MLGLRALVAKNKGIAAFLISAQIASGRVSSPPVCSLPDPVACRNFNGGTLAFSEAFSMPVDSGNEKITELVKLVGAV